MPFDIVEYINSLPNDCDCIDISNKNITFIPDLSRFSYLKKLTDDQKESIQNGIKEIFTETINESSRVEVLSSQKGGGSLNIVALFSFLCVLMQTVNYSFYMQFITHEIRQLDNDMKGLSGSMDYGLVKYADSSVKQIYDEQFSYPPDKTILYYVLNNIFSLLSLFNRARSFFSCKIKFIKVKFSSIIFNYIVSIVVIDYIYKL